jgi:hypothetical protein
LASPLVITLVMLALAFVDTLFGLVNLPEFRDLMCENFGYFCKPLDNPVDSKEKKSRPAEVCMFSGCPMPDGIADDGVQPSTEFSSKPVLNETRPATQASPKSVTKKEFLQTHERAEQGNADAQFRLGNMYMYGDGVPKSLEEAINWFRKSAEQGYVPAQKKICFLSDNLREAEHWCLRASGAQGEVGTLRHDEAGSRTQEQKAEAQRIVEQDAEVIQIQLF